MDTNTTLTTVATATPTETEESSLKSINSALFLVFAEFLGYETPLTEWAEAHCKGKPIQEFQKKAIAIDANQVFRLMKVEYTLTEIKDWYNKFHDAILFEYEPNLNDGLPF